jgi:hypothetical protein
VRESSNPRRDAGSEKQSDNEYHVGERDLGDYDHDARRPFMLADPFEVAAETGEAKVAGLRTEAVFVEKVNHARTVVTVVRQVTPMTVRRPEGAGIEEVPHLSPPDAASIIF